MSLLLAVALLAVVLVAATVRPFGLPEIVLAAPAAAVAVLAGLVTPAGAWAEVADLAPTVGFLAAILLLGHLADAEGVFRWVGARLGSASDGSPRRLLVLVFAVAAGTTAVLSLDATVVLLTPVVLATAARRGWASRPHSYACVHLSNSASGLLPVSNLTNLLAFSASGLGFLGFAGLMAAPWVAVIVVEYLVLRWFFARDLQPAPAVPGSGVPGGGSVPGTGVPGTGSGVSGTGSGVSGTGSGSALETGSVSETGSAPEAGSVPETRSAPEAGSVPETRSAPEAGSVPETRSAPEAGSVPKTGAGPDSGSRFGSGGDRACAGPGRAPRFALGVLALTLAGFGASSAAGIEPGWIAAAGAAVLAVRALVRRETGPLRLVAAASPGFCLFVLALGVVVAGVSGQGLAGWLGGLLPDTPDLVGLLLTAVIAAVLANVVNNLPATLVLLAALGPAPPTGLVLAVLLGVNIGPNLTYAGSLATLLWRRIAAGYGDPPRFTTFAGLGTITVPLGLLAATLALWASLTLAG